MDSNFSDKLLDVLKKLVVELYRNEIHCEKIKLIVGLMQAKKVVSFLEIRQKIIFDMRPVYDNGRNTKEIDDLLEEIYLIMD